MERMICTSLTAVIPLKGTNRVSHILRVNMPSGLQDPPDTFVLQDVLFNERVMGVPVTG